MEELRLAHVDDLTGALRRGMGEVALQHEIDRARRGDSRLVLAYIDVDGLKGINDRSGHGAGDELLRRLIAAVRSKMRSYEPLVRYGGDEFICSIGDIDIPAAERRFEGIKEELADSGNGGTFTVGFAELKASDSLSDLIGRADIALTRARLA